jgi:uncharacterized membrane protein YphA (DoxX/SURF4 family)
MMINLGCANPGLLAWMATLSELGGGVLVLLGLVTQLGAALIISTMVVAIYTVHWKNGFLSSNRGYEFNFSLIGISVALILTGAGSYSIDNALGLARAIDLFPVWVPVVLILVMFGGVVTTELSRRMYVPPQQATAQK